MTPRGRRIAFACVSVAIALGAGAMIYLQKQDIEKNRQEATRLEGEIAKARALIKQTPDLVKEIIIQRETEDVIKEILSDQEDVNNFVRTLHSFAEDSGVTISKIQQPRQSSTKKKEEFDKVAYTLSFEATAFQLLDFLDRVESYPRFMSVTAFKLTAARRASYKEDTEPRHRVTLDLETYVYEPKAGGKEVKIDGYEHKRDLLVSEISKRAADLRVETYDYAGARGRRDPWVDPRVPVPADEEDAWPIPEQIAFVDQLVEQVNAAKTALEAVKASTTILEEMKSTAQLEDGLTAIEEQIRRAQEGKFLTFVSAERRFQQDVVGATQDMRDWIENRPTKLGPSLAELEDAKKAMDDHVAHQEYELAVDVYNTIETGLNAIPTDDTARQPLVQVIRKEKETIDNVLAFESIQLDIGGVAIHEGHRPVALINGQPVAEGELLTDELVVRNIRKDHIEFAYRGLVLARPIESALTSPQAQRSKSNR